MLTLYLNLVVSIFSILCPKLPFEPSDHKSAIFAISAVLDLDYFRKFFCPITFTIVISIRGKRNFRPLKRFRDEDVRAIQNLDLENDLISSGDEYHFYKTD